MSFPPNTPLAFEVVSTTSAHSAHPASELFKRDGNAGWHSSPLSDEPFEEIVLRLRDGPCTIHMLEILAHEFMIPQKIEIIVASNDADDEDTADFEECANIRRLGFVALCTNAQSNYSSRELKTVSLGGQHAQLVKLRLHACHPNELNVHNQVAIQGLELIGCSASASSIDDLSQEGKKKGEGEEEGGNQETMPLCDEDASSRTGSDNEADDSTADGGSSIETSSIESNANTCSSGNTNASLSDHSADVGLSSCPKPSLQLASESSGGPGDNAKVNGKITSTTTAESPPPPSQEPALSAQEFMERRKRVDNEVQRRLDRLNQIKLQLAAVEDFERAAAAKAVLDKTKKIFSKLSNLETHMRLASEKEDYGQASNLKSQRDLARVEAMSSLDDAESSVAKICREINPINVAASVVKVGAEESIATSSLPSRASVDDKSSAHSGTRACSSKQWQGIDIHHLSTTSQADATCSRDAGDDAYVFVQPKSPNLSLNGGKEENVSTHQDDHKQRELTQIQSPSHGIDSSLGILSASQTSLQPTDHQECNDCDSFSVDSGATSSSAPYHGNALPDIREEYDEDTHPLKGVSDYMVLPVPEAINVEGGGIATDTIARIESLVGTYLTRCFFSRNYSLREAALTKLSLMLPDMGQQLHDDEIYARPEEAIVGSSPRSHRNNYLRTVCIMLERALGDRVIPVFVASLLLLDDCISEFEQSGMTSKEVLSHLSVITPSLVSHLGDTKNKVVEGAETALLSMALSKCIGPAYIAHLLTKQTTEMRAARAIIARMRVAKVSSIWTLFLVSGSFRK